MVRSNVVQSAGKMFPVASDVSILLHVAGQARSPLDLRSDRANLEDALYAADDAQYDR